MPAPKLLITGLPRTGKSTLAMEVARELGLKLAGISTPETKEAGERTGFALLDLKTGKKGTLSSKSLRSPASVGGYGVNLSDLNDIGAEALEAAAFDTSVDLIVIDEIGKMELFSKRFEEAVVACLKSNKPVLAVLHRDYLDKFGKYGELLHLTLDNRPEIKKRLKEALRVK